MFDSCIAGNEANWGELLDFPMLCIFLSYVILYAFAMDNNFVLARVEGLHLTVTSGGLPDKLTTPGQTNLRCLSLRQTHHYI